MRIWNSWPILESKALGGRSAKFVMMTFVLTLAVGCNSPSTQGLSFAASGTSFGGVFSGSDRETSKAAFVNGDVILAAPGGHCIDPHMLRRDRQGGFALLPRCSLLLGNSLFANKQAAVITATIGKAPPGSSAPQATDLALSAGGADLLESNEGDLLTLAKLHLPDHHADGAAPTHWRGAFILNDHLVVLALYAPEGSQVLGSRGATLLTEMAERTMKASLLEDTLQMSQQTSLAPVSAPQLSHEGPLRPRLRPAEEKTLKERTSIATKLASFFH